MIKIESQNKLDVSIRHISELDEFEKLGGAWRALYDECNLQEAFLTWEWMFAWWKHYHRGKKLWLITAWLDNDLCGIAPLMVIDRPKYGLNFRSLVNLSQPDNDISGFIVRNNNPEILDAMCSYIMTKSREWDLIEMAELPACGPEARALISASQKFRCDRKEEIFRHYYLSITGDWGAFFNCLDPSEKEDLKKNMHRAQKAGGVTFQKFIGTSLNWSHFQEVFRINQHGRYPCLYNETERKFLEELYNLTREREFIEIAFTKLKDDYVAFNLGFTINGRHEGWRTAYDRSYSKIGPGRNMFALLFANFFNDGYREVDFLRGTEVYKGCWKPSFREYIDIRIVSKTNLPANIVFIQLPRLKALYKRLAGAINSQNPGAGRHSFQ